MLACAAAIALVWSAARSSSRSPAHAVAIYDSNRDHLWNRLHATFFVRDDLPETRQLADVLDPPLWWDTTYLLSKPSHRKALGILDEFLRTHGEGLIHYPIRRAILQRDLWAVFDWTVAHPSEDGVRCPPKAEA